MAELIVINTGPLIALARIETLDVIGRLPVEFCCPQEVLDELDRGMEAGLQPVNPVWLRVAPLRAPLSPLALSSLDLGEAAVIQLALELGVSRVCIDEWKGRRAALATGLQVTGALGLLGRAKLLGLIPSLRPLVERAVEQGIRYHPDLVRQVLQAVDE
jgi:predicted nucleic acid-binding protein